MECLKKFYTFKFFSVTFKETRKRFYGEFCHLEEARASFRKQKTDPIKVCNTDDHVA